MSKSIRWQWLPFIAAILILIWMGRKNTLILEHNVFLAVLVVISFLLVLFLWGFRKRIKK